MTWREDMERVSRQIEGGPGQSGEAGEELSVCGSGTGTGRVSGTGAVRKDSGPSEQIFEEQFGKRTGTEERRHEQKMLQGNLEKASQKRVHLEKLFCVKYNIFDSSIFKQTLLEMQGPDIALCRMWMPQ